MQDRRNLQRENEELRVLIEAIEDDLTAYEAKNKDLENENLTLLARIDELQTKIRELKSQCCCQLNQGETQDTETCNHSCCNYELCNKKILIVGGISKFKSFYRDLIEEKGGKFDYLDGYMKGGEKALDIKIRRCDLVLCPVDCNSHNACLSVKKLCKKHGKPFKMLTSSSVSGITQAIR